MIDRIGVDIVEQDIRVILQRDHGNIIEFVPCCIIHKRGSRTLCTIHYIDWNQKKNLNLSSYKELPKRPINLEQNTELNFLQRVSLRNDKEFTPELLESLIPTKKVKRPQENTENNEDNNKNEPRDLEEGEIAQDGMEVEK